MPSILPWDILNKDLQRPLKLLINHPQTRPDAPRSEGGDVPVDNHPWASAASVIKSGGGGVKAESFQTVVEMEAIILVTKRKVGKKKRIMVELLFLIAVFYSPCLDVVMLWMFNNVVLDLCRLMWRHFPYWYRYQNNLNIYRRSSSSMLHRHLSTVARRRQTLNFTYRFFVCDHTHLAVCLSDNGHTTIYSSLQPRCWSWGTIPGCCPVFSVNKAAIQ